MTTRKTNTQAASGSAQKATRKPIGEEKTPRSRKKVAPKYSTEKTIAEKVVPPTEVETAKVVEAEVAVSTPVVEKSSTILDPAAPAILESESKKTTVSASKSRAKKTKTDNKKKVASKPIEKEGSAEVVLPLLPVLKNNWIEKDGFLFQPHSVVQSYADEVNKYYDAGAEDPFDVMHNSGYLVPLQQEIVDEVAKIFEAAFPLDENNKRIHGLRRTVANSSAFYMTKSTSISLQIGMMTNPLTGDTASYEAMICFHPKVKNGYLKVADFFFTDPSDEILDTCASYLWADFLELPEDFNQMVDSPEKTRIQDDVKNSRATIGRHVDLTDRFERVMRATYQSEEQKQRCVKDEWEKVIREIAKNAIDVINDIGPYFDEIIASAPKKAKPLVPKSGTKTSSKAPAKKKYPSYDPSTEDGFNSIKKLIKNTASQGLFSKSGLRPEQVVPELMKRKIIAGSLGGVQNAVLLQLAKDSWKEYTPPTVDQTQDVSAKDKD